MRLLTPLFVVLVDFLNDCGFCVSIIEVCDIREEVKFSICDMNTTN